MSQPRNQFNGNMEYDIHMENGEPEINNYLEECGALEVIDKSLQALYQTDPQPRFVVRYLCTQVLLFNKSSVHPAMQLVGIRARIQELKSQCAILREICIARIHENYKN